MRKIKDGSHGVWVGFLVRLLKLVARMCVGYLGAGRARELVHDEMYAEANRRASKQVTTGVLLSESVRNLIRLRERPSIYSEIAIMYALVELIYRRQPRRATAADLFWDLSKLKDFEGVGQARVDDVLKLMVDEGWVTRDGQWWCLQECGYSEGRPNMMSRREKVATHGVEVVQGLMDYVAGKEGAGLHVVTAVGSDAEFVRFMQAFHKSIVEHGERFSKNSEEVTDAKEHRIYIITRKPEPGD